MWEIRHEWQGKRDLGNKVIASCTSLIILLRRSSPIAMIILMNAPSLSCSALFTLLPLNNLSSSSKVIKGSKSFSEKPPFSNIWTSPITLILNVSINKLIDLNKCVYTFDAIHDGLLVL